MKVAGGLVPPPSGRSSATRSAICRKLGGPGGWGGWPRRSDRKPASGQGCGALAEWLDGRLLSMLPEAGGDPLSGNDYPTSLSSARVTASPITEVETRAMPVCMMSAVRSPPFSTFSTAWSIRSASFERSKE